MYQHGRRQIYVVLQKPPVLARSEDIRMIMWFKWDHGMSETSPGRLVRGKDEWNKSVVFVGGLNAQSQVARALLILPSNHIYLCGLPPPTMSDCPSISVDAKHPTSQPLVSEEPKAQCSEQRDPPSTQTPARRLSPVPEVKLGVSEVESLRWSVTAMLMVRTPARRHQADVSCTETPIPTEPLLCRLSV